MRKRLIGKAFAIAMSGAMVLTATPVTANIFNVAQIVKADDEKADDYVYCYAGLTWNEYWTRLRVLCTAQTTMLQSRFLRASLWRELTLFTDVLK